MNIPNRLKFALLADQALETMFIHPCPNHSRSQDLKNQEYHIHYGGRQLRHKLHRWIQFTSHKVKYIRNVRNNHTIGIETYMGASCWNGTTNKNQPVVLNPPWIYPNNQKHPSLSMFHIHGKHRCTDTEIIIFGLRHIPHKISQTRNTKIKKHWFVNLIIREPTT